MAPHFLRDLGPAALQPAPQHEHLLLSRDELLGVVVQVCELLTVPGHYRTEYDEKNKVFRKTPLHSWASHCADAWRYLSIGWKEISSSPLPPRNRKEITYEATPDGVRSNLTFAEIIKARERKAKRMR